MTILHLGTPFFANWEWAHSILNYVNAYFVPINYLFQDIKYDIVFRS
jgi:hypothetical protein